MKAIDSPEELQEILLQTLERASSFFKAISHVKRYQILVLLLDGPKTFRFLLKNLDIGKTALANHLLHLKAALLVEKIEHGTYLLTYDGKNLLQAMGQVYENSEFKKLHVERELQKQYSKSYQKLVKTRRNRVSTEPVFEDCWLSYLGAFIGIFKAVGQVYDLTAFGGYTGYAFVINVAKDRLCASGPSSLPLKNWEEIIKGTEQLSGWKLKVIGDQQPFPSSQSLNDRDKARARDLFTQITREIDCNDRPVILWGLHVPEYGIVTGYEGESYLCSTYRHTVNLAEIPVPYDSLQASSGLHAILLAEKKPEKPERLDQEAIKRAMKLAKGESAVPGYINGPDALNEWAKALENATLDDFSYHSNSYVGGCLQESTAIASRFLHQIAAKHGDGPQVESLANTAKEYERMSELASKFVKTFPFAFEGKIEEEERIKGAEIIRAMIPYHRSAIAALEKAVNTWH